MKHILHYLSIITLLTTFHSCSENPKNIGVAKLSNPRTETVTSNTAQVKITVDGHNVSFNLNVRFISEDRNDTAICSNVNVPSGNNDVILNFTNLKINTPYQYLDASLDYQSLALDDQDFTHSFRTNSTNLFGPIGMTNKTTSSLSLNCTASPNSGSSIQTIVLELYSNDKSTKFDSVKATTTNTISGTFSNLVENTSYQARCRTEVKNTSTSIVTEMYSDFTPFTTDPKNKVLPTIITSDASSIANNSAVLNGNITSAGGDIISAQGFLWGTSSPPTTNIAFSGTKGLGTYTDNLSGLNKFTTYYVKAYATNSVGTSYGAEQSFKTLADIPKVTTNDASSITATSASLSATLTDDGGANITESGFYISTSPNPVSTGTKTQGTLSGTTITLNKTGLTNGSSYYIVAYAINNGGKEGKGAEKQFVATNLTTPTVVTLSTDPNNSTCDQAILKYSVTNDGGSAVTSRGFCISKSPNPTTSNSITNDGTGVANNVTTSSITLEPNTIYYARSYASNSTGTGYGSEMSFTTNLLSGCYYNGGNVAYVFQPVDPGYEAKIKHGLIDEGSDFTGRWGTGTGTSEAFGTGQSNTMIIAEPNSAAFTCKNLVTKGYNDWFLPSKEELLKISSNCGKCNLTSTYWSSSEVNTSPAEAWTMTPPSTMNQSNKSESKSLRCYRQF